jgi:hypothetical protein
MTRGQASASAVIEAPPGRVYEILADYQHHHPRIVPRRYFRRLEVEEGGVGAGTRTRLEMRVLGSTRVFRHLISEPEPGRVLVETDVSGYSTTTFTVDPSGDGTSSRLTIVTKFNARDGLLGQIERWLTSRMLRRIYVQELQLLSEYARGADAPVA